MTKGATINAIFVSAGLVGLALMIIAVALRAVTVLGEPTRVEGAPSGPSLMSAPLVNMAESAQLMESGS